MTTNPVVAVHAIVVFGLDLVVVEEILVVLGAVGFVAGVVVVVQVESLVVEVQRRQFPEFLILKIYHDFNESTKSNFRCQKIPRNLIMKIYK
jgi:hypothetical protein